MPGARDKAHRVWFPGLLGHCSQVVPIDVHKQKHHTHKLSKFLKKKENTVLCQSLFLRPGSDLSHVSPFEHLVIQSRANPSTYAIPLDPQQLLPVTVAYAPEPTMLTSA